MTTSSFSVLDAINAAHKRPSIDDLITVEDDAVYSWLRAHALSAQRFPKLVIGAGYLPTRWKAIGKTFRTPQDVFTYVNEILAHENATKIATIFHQITKTSSPNSVADMKRKIADEIVCGRGWVLPVRELPNGLITKADPKVFSQLNSKLGTNVDFFAISKYEGDQHLRGYVPFSRQNNSVIANSGMTVATGFDIGQWTVSELRLLGLSEGVLCQISPFAHHTMKGMNKIQLVADVARRAPVPLLTKEEADECDSRIMLDILRQSVRAWNDGRSKDVPNFTSLPTGWQTVWFSRFYQEGSSTDLSAALAFREAALQGNWEEAIKARSVYTLYPERKAEELALLKSQIPPKVGP